MNRFLLAIVLGALALPGVAQNRPFTFKDMMALKRVEEPEVSPDGKWVLFAVVDVDLNLNRKTPHVWVVPLGESNRPPNPSAGSARGEKEIIADQDGDRPRWAPDGKRFAFISTKENGSQVWIADFDGASGTVTAKHRLTAISTEADGELWSPEGKNILFVSNVYAECQGTPAEESACIDQKLTQSKDSKLSAQIFSHLLYRHWNGYKESKRSHLFVIAVKTLPGADPSNIARDLTPGDHDVPPFSLGGQDMYSFSPDGEEICFTSNHDEDEATSTNNDLFTVPVNWRADASSVQVLAQTRDLTADNKAADETPLYSPDGRAIAYRAQVRPGYESDRWRLLVYDRKTGGRQDLTENFDQWVESFVWAPDSKTIFFSSQHKGHALIYALDTGGTGSHGSKVSRRTLVGGYNDDLAVTPDGHMLIFSRVSIAAPNEIYASDASGSGCPSMTGNVDPGKEACSLNAAWPVTALNQPVLSQVLMPKMESFTFTGARNEPVEGFLIKPPAFDTSKKYPLKFLIHGGPEGAWGDDWSYRWNPELFAANGYVVVMINFHGSTGYGQEFIDAINGNWGGAPFEDLMKGLDYAEQQYPFIDKDRECALGASYGGYMANWILGHTQRFKCIVSHDGMFNTTSAWDTTEELWFMDWEFKGTPYSNRELYRKWSPHLAASNFKTPTLVIHGQLDYRLDVSEGFQLFTTLQSLGVPSKMLYFPDEGHWVLKPQNSELWYKTVNQWVDQWVGNPTARDRRQ
jgi:dipeptidyl aminopeptidase/acylaminoacyl peptidase